MDKKKKTRMQIVLVILILMLAVIASKVLRSLKKDPEMKPPAVSAPLLNAESVFAQTLQMTVAGSGTVQPRMPVRVVPQVSGRVIQCHPQFINGGFFKANEPLVVVEQTDYELAVESAAAAVAQAEVQVEQETAEADVAKKEWDKMRPGEKPDSVLVFREPQIRNAQAQLKAAKARLAKAELDLERTTIKMPFDGRVVSTNVDIGQFITAGASIATVYRTDLVEIVVPLEDSELAWFDVPQNSNGQNNKKLATLAKVYSDFAGKEHQWLGWLVRTEGQIDPKSRMVHVVVQVNNPFEVEAGQQPLVPGMFVHVDIQGNQMQNIFRIPRYAVRNSTEVWVAKPFEPADENNIHSDQLNEDFRTLKICPVQIIRMDKNFAYVSEGLSDNDIVISSPLETVADGMTIRVHLMTQPESNGSKP